MNTSVQSLSQSLFRVPLGSVEQSLALFRASSEEQTAGWLRAYYGQSINRQALYLASPTLFHHVCAWLLTTDTVLPPDLELSMARYVIRSATRATPFGLFAGLCMATLGDCSDITFSSDRLSPFTRLDSSALVQLYDQVLNDTRWRHKLRFIVSNSTYKAKTQYRYSEFIEQQQGRLVVMSGLDADEYLNGLVNYARVYRSYDELKQYLVVAAGVDDGEAGEYVDSLIDNKFLLSELEPTVTGQPYVERLKLWLSSADSPDELSTWVADQPSVIQELMEVEAFQRTDSWLTQRGFFSTNQQSFWQTNLWFNTRSATLARPVINQIGTQLTEVYPALEQPRLGWIQSFAQRFRSRYQDRAVPLLKALDNESGLGLRSANDYLASSAPRAEHLQRYFRQATEPTSEDKSTSALRRHLLEQALRNNAIESELKGADIPEGNSAPEGHWSMLGTLLKRDRDGSDSGSFDFLLQGVNATSTALAGRFCQDSTELADFVKAIHDGESQQFADCVLAEVVHLVGNRSGNVNVRPTLRAYEIPYLTPASVPDEYVINLSDLLVSVNTSLEVSLFSTKLNKAVLPRLTTAHNVAKGDEIYRFLCAVGQQQNNAAKWNWKELSVEPFLPRLRYKKLILARAQWHVSATTLSRFDSAGGCWVWFKETYPVPQYLSIQTDDNELLVDVNTPMGNRLVVGELTRRKKVTLTEWLSSPDKCWIKDAEDQRYCHEALLFYESPVRSSIAKRGGIGSGLCQEKTSITRKFPPGSEWLYLKLYCGPEMANQLLAGPIQATLADIHRQGRIQQWFFVRYLDPEFHLRLRVQCCDPAYRSLLMTELLGICQEWVADELVDTVQLDTYDREIERYGEQTIELCEDYFAADTRMVTEFLAQYPDADEEMLIHFAVISAIALVADFGFTDADSLAFFRSRQRAYHREFSVSKEIKDVLNQQFREYRELMKHWKRRVTTAEGDPTPIPHITTLLDQRTADTYRTVHTLNQKLSPSGVATTFSVIGSLLHMSMNRLLTSQLRLYELIIYHLSCRYYESTVARSKA